MSNGAMLPIVGEMASTRSNMSLQACTYAAKVEGATKALSFYILLELFLLRPLYYFLLWVLCRVGLLLRS